MDKLIQNTLLYDFYGELLTPKQRDIYNMHFCEDMSMAEIGDKLGITRQAVNCSLKEAQKLLEFYNGVLRLIENHASLAAFAADLRHALDNKDFALGKRVLAELEESHGL